MVAKKRKRYQRGESGLKPWILEAMLDVFAHNRFEFEPTIVTIVTATDDDLRTPAPPSGKCTQGLTRHHFAASCVFGERGEWTVSPGQGVGSGESKPIDTYQPQSRTREIGVVAQGRAMEGVYPERAWASSLFENTAHSGKWL